MLEDSTANAVDQHFMRLALQQARGASGSGEVPVGAVIVKNGVVIATGQNAPISSQDPTAHAEISALRAAALTLGNYRLEGCTLYITLEPCAMCAGAMLHARLARVVFGAPDAKTGAAGSVINLFEQPLLNHQTVLEGGVLERECSALLQAFFKQRRAEQRAQAQLRHPLRDDAVRPPDAAFKDLAGYPWQPNYISDLPSLAGLRMHYLDEAEKKQKPEPLSFLCLHGNPAWSYLYRHMIPVFLAAGHRVIVPDLIGFGKSDKPKRGSFHHFAIHRNILLEFIERLDLQRVVLVVQDWGGLLGLTLPMAAPERFKALLVMNTLLACGDVELSSGFAAWRKWCADNPDFDVGRLLARSNPQLSSAECAAYNAPFPDSGHRAALRAFPAMVPSQTNDAGAVISQAAREFWRQRWRGQTLMVIGEQDPVLGVNVMQSLRRDLCGCPAPTVLAQAGHFVPEHGGTVAQQALALFVGTASSAP